MILSRRIRVCSDVVICLLGMASGFLSWEQNMPLNKEQILAEASQACRLGSTARSSAHVHCGLHGMPQPAGSWRPLPSLPPSTQLPGPQILSPQSFWAQHNQPDHDLQHSSSDFAKMWVLPSALFFPDPFVVFDHVAQLVLMEILFCCENHLSWSS